MKKIITHTTYVLVIALFLFLSKTDAENKNRGNGMEKNIKQVTVKDIDGKSVNLADYKGKVLLIVNVASYCGLYKTICWFGSRFTKSIKIKDLKF